MWCARRPRHDDRGPPGNAPAGRAGPDLGDRLQSRPVSLDGTDRSRRASPLPGISGVIYALFGYIWMKGLYEPEQGMILHPNTVTIMLALARALHDRCVRPDRQRRALRGTGRGRRLRRAAVSSRTTRPGSHRERRHGFTSDVPGAPGGRRDRRRLHRAGARRGAAADRRRGRRAAGIVARAGDARRPGGWRFRASIATSTNCWTIGRVGVVHVASPNAHHFEQAQRVLESGRHVICEKPLATSSQETAALRRWPSRGRHRRPRSITTSATTRSATRSASGSPAARWAACSASPARTSRTGCSTPTITTGASSPTAGRTSAPWPTSARTGWTWPSF